MRFVSSVAIKIKSSLLLILSKFETVENQDLEFEIVSFLLPSIFTVITKQNICSSLLTYVAVRSSIFICAKNIEFTLHSITIFELLY